MTTRKPDMTVNVGKLTLTPPENLSPVTLHNWSDR